MRPARVARLALALLQMTGAICAAQAPLRVARDGLIYDGIPAAVMAAADPLAAWPPAHGGARLLDWLADGSLLVSAGTQQAAQLQRVRAPPATPQALMRDAGPVVAAVAHPYDANVLVYRKDGGELPQLWLRDLADGSEHPLADGISRHDRPVFAHDGRRIAYSGNARSAGAGGAAGSDVYVSDTGSQAAPRLVLGGYGADLLVQEWSPDDQRLAVIRRRSRTDAELLLVDVVTGAAMPVEPAPRNTRGARATKGTPPGPVSIAAARFARSGDSLYFIADRGAGFMSLYRTDLHTGQFESLTPVSGPDVERFDLSPDGRLLAYASNEAGLSRLVLRDLHLRADVLLPPLPAGAVIDDLRFDRRSDRLAVALQTAAAPAQVFVYDIHAGEADTLPTVALARWTGTGPGEAQSPQLTSAQLIDYPTWDQDGDHQRRLPAFVFRPRAAGIHPVLIDIHDGPAAQFRPRWDALREYLVDQLGYVVIAPNVRGSAGYGPGFSGLDDGPLREDAVRDIGALLVWIGAQPDMDRGRVAVMGRAYGGYMALAALAQYGDRLAGGIAVDGITDFPAFLARGTSATQAARRAEYGDERDPDTRALLTAISPVTNAAAIVKPLLIVQEPENSPATADESERMKALVRAHGTQVWYLAAQDQGHGVRDAADGSAWRATAVAFLKQIFADSK